MRGCRCPAPHRPRFQTHPALLRYVDRALLDAVKAQLGPVPKADSRLRQALVPRVHCWWCVEVLLLPIVLALVPGTTPLSSYASPTRPPLRYQNNKSEAHKPWAVGDAPTGCAPGLGEVAGTPRGRDELANTVIGQCRRYANERANGLSGCAPGRPRLAIEWTARRDIEMGEELCFEYGVPDESWAR